MTRYEAIIRRHFDIVGQSGDEFVCRCKWHADGEKPNLYVNAVKGLYICHSCGMRGHLKSLGDRLPPVSGAVLRARLKPKLESVPRRLPESWLRQFAFEHDAWAERGLSPEIQRRFGLGYDPLHDVLVIPLRDETGALLGIITRRLDDRKPKYRYPRGFPIGKCLYGSWLIDNRRKVALVEGSLDAIACWDARVPALALLGSRLTRDQARLLQKLRVGHIVIMTDNDRPGQEAIQQIHDALRNTGIAVSVGVYRSYWLDKDPADLKPDRRRKMFHSAKLYPG